MHKQVWIFECIVSMGYKEYGIELDIKAILKLCLVILKALESTYGVHMLKMTVYVDTQIS